MAKKAKQPEKEPPTAAALSANRISGSPEIKELKGLLRNTESVIIHVNQVLYDGVKQIKDIVLDPAMVQGVCSGTIPPKRLKARVVELRSEQKRIEDIFKNVSKLQKMLINGSKLTVKSGLGEIKTVAVRV